MTPSLQRSHTVAILADLLKQRQSCRAFLPTPVPRDTIRDMLGLAQRTASWCNAQPWQVTMLSGAALDRVRDGLTETAAASAPSHDVPFPSAYEGVYGERRRDCGEALHDALGIERGDREARAAQTMRNFAMFGAPHVAVISSPVSLGAYGIMDCGAYVATLMTAATGFGLASIAQAAPANFSAYMRAAVGLADDRLFLCTVSFGHADHDHPANRFRTRRAEIDEVVEFID